MSQAWTWKPLGEVCKTGSGGTPLSSRKEFYEGGTIPWLVSGEVAQGNVLEAKNFITAAGINATHIPYKGEAAALSDLIAGQIDFCACNVPASTGFIKSGQIKALAVTSAKRLAALPNIPTVAEASIPGFENVGWFALMAPSNTPKVITDKIYAAAIKAVKSEAMQKSLELNSLTPVLNTQKELEAQIVAESAKWEKVIKARNLTAN